MQCVNAGDPDYLLQFVLPRTITENQMHRGFAPRPRRGSEPRQAKLRPS